MAGGGFHCATAVAVVVGVATVNVPGVELTDDAEDPTGVDVFNVMPAMPPD